ncbi:MAG: biotin--[acetyl-CoA-carboxylase] ligase [Leptolyngbyaceae bacterium]|nr:biotin--[acetyl-CoA-carboxylase] ligase [Leptolyngbyaceae bacterium]
MEFDRQRFEAAWQQRQQSGLSFLPEQLHVFETLPSTNRTLWDLIEQGAEPGTTVIALQQQAGRGQWGRQWQSPLGGLYLSWAIAPQLPVSQGAQLTLCSAWGIATQLRTLGIPVLIKWPNDLVLQGRKLGGILTESRLYQGQISKAVIGVGINWSNPVPETGINLQSYLMQEPDPPLQSLEDLIVIVLQGLITGYNSWQQGGMEAFLPAYLELLANLGDAVVVDNRAGVVVGVSPDGDLQVRLSPLDPDLDADENPISSTASAEISLKPGTISLGYR